MIISFERNVVGKASFFHIQFHQTLLYFLKLMNFHFRPTVATLDHKPSNPPERERIQNAGGNVMIQRVNGSLAVSRYLQYISNNYELYDKKQFRINKAILLSHLQSIR